MASKPQPTATSPGRAPRKYRPEYARQARVLCRLGALDADLADAFEVSERTIIRWRVTHAAFRAACLDFKSVADDNVERAYYQLAVGYEHDAVQIFLPKGSRKPVYAPYRERVAPNERAAFNWLKNRRPQEWKEKVEVAGDHRHHLSAEPVSATAEWIAGLLGGGAPRPPQKPRS